MTTPLVQPTIADKGPWKVAEDGKALHSNDFTVDARLVIDGDFIDDYHRKDYAAWLAGVLNAATPSRAGGGEVGEWVSVKDRLPEDGQLVVVVHDYGMAVANPSHADYGKRYVVKVTHCSGRIFHSDIMQTGTAIKWQPLPPLPAALHGAGARGGEL